MITYHESDRNYVRIGLNGDHDIYLKKDDEYKELAKWHEERHIKYYDEEQSKLIKKYIVKRVESILISNPSLNKKSIVRLYGRVYNVMEDERIESFYEKDKNIRKDLREWKSKIRAEIEKNIANKSNMMLDPVNSLLLARFLCKSRTGFTSGIITEIRTCATDKRKFFSLYKKYCDEIVEHYCLNHTEWYK